MSVELDWSIPNAQFDISFDKVMRDVHKKLSRKEKKDLYKRDMKLRTARLPLELFRRLTLYHSAILLRITHKESIPHITEHGHKTMYIYSKITSKLNLNMFSRRKSFVPQPPFGFPRPLDLAFIVFESDAIQDRLHKGLVLECTAPRLGVRDQFK